LSAYATKIRRSLVPALLELPAVKRAKKVKTLSRVYRLIEPVEITEQDNEPRLSFSTRFLFRPVCRTGTAKSLPADYHQIFGNGTG
jgi:hypothetical protein